MTLLEDIKDRLRLKEHLPNEVLIREDQLEQLAEELNELRMHPFKDVPKMTAENIRTGGCWIFGIPVRVAPPRCP